MSMMKEKVVTPLTLCSMDTGYSYEYLNECVDELIEDGQNLLEAVQNVIEVAYELDL